MTQPFTYKVTHLPSGQWYYGVRYAVNCKPSDLWTSYFTSSSKVKILLERDGTAAFTYEIRKEFNSPTDAIAWEHRVCKRILGIPNCLNESAWPAVRESARSKGHETKRATGDDGLTGFQRATAKWIAKRHQINPETGKTYEQERIERSIATKMKPENAKKREAFSQMTSERLTKNNPSTNPEVRARMTASLKASYEAGTITTTKGMKFPELSAKLKGKQFTLGLCWFNDGEKNYRFAIDDPRCADLIKGRLVSKGAASHGYKSPIITCPHCNKHGGKSNMTRYHFDNCKLIEP